MADNVAYPLPDGTTTNVDIASDDVSGVQFQKVKLDLGGDGLSVPVVGTMPVSDAGGSLTVDGTVSVGNFPATQTVAGTVAVSNFPATQPVSAASLPLPTGAATDAALGTDGTSPPTLPGGSTGVRGWLRYLGSLLSGTLNVSAASLPLPTGAATDRTTAAAPSASRLSDGSAFYDARSIRALTSADQVTVAALPATAATAANQTATNTSLSSIDGKTPALGQAAMAASSPVVIASDQSALPTTGPLISATGTLAALNAAVTLDCSGMQWVAFDTWGTFSANYALQGLRGDGTWQALNFWTRPMSFNTSPTQSGNGVGMWIAPSGGYRQVRLTLTSYASGTMSYALREAQSGPQLVTLMAPTLGTSTARIGYVGAHGIQYDETTTALAANATFTGASRDATNAPPGNSWFQLGAYTQEVRVSAEQDVVGTLWLEVSLDGSTGWRRIKSVTLSAVTGGGFYGEIIHRPSHRYWRCGLTNGATAAARTLVSSLAQAA